MGSRRRRRSSRHAEAGRGRGTLDLEVGLSSLEVARGRDGLFRGEPDPCLVVGAWAAQTGGRIATLARNVLRIPAERQLRPGPPGVSTPEDIHPAPLLRASMIPDGAPALLVLVIGLEEDDAESIERVYAALERGADLAVWWEGAAVPEPQPLGSLTAAAPGALLGESVRVIQDARDLADSVSDGTWVGASLLRSPLARRAKTETVRCHLTSAGGENDWTALLTVRLG